MKDLPAVMVQHIAESIALRMLAKASARQQLAGVIRVGDARKDAEGQWYSRSKVSREVFDIFSFAHLISSPTFSSPSSFILRLLFLHLIREIPVNELLRTIANLSLRRPLLTASAPHHGLV